MPRQGPGTVFPRRKHRPCPPADRGSQKRLPPVPGCRHLPPVGAGVRPGCRRLGRHERRRAPRPEAPRAPAPAAPPRGTATANEPFQTAGDPPATGKERPRGLRLPATALPPAIPGGFLEPAAAHLPWQAEPIWTAVPPPSRRSTGWCRPVRWSPGCARSAGPRPSTYGVSGSRRRRRRPSR